MTTNRTRRRRSRRELSDEETAWLRGGRGGADQVYFMHDDELAALWLEFAEDIVAEHIEMLPGTRPLRWWEYSAPEKQRQRLGGIGTPCHEKNPCFLRLTLGVPNEWVWSDSPEWYRLNGTILDTDDPPTFESQAAYLERLDLLLPGERKRLKPEDFEPESVIDILGIELEEADDDAEE